MVNVIVTIRPSYIIVDVYVNIVFVSLIINRSSIGFICWTSFCAAMMGNRLHVLLSFVLLGYFEERIFYN